MISKKDKGISSEAISLEKDAVDDLKQFIQKKKNQNAALKKLISNLNTGENHEIDK